jgi:hypothetical protein
LVLAVQVLELVLAVQVLELVLAVREQVLGLVKVL